jgi:radical SAM superfamily enzyme YgiQ (UPF0313 family)
MKIALVFPKSTFLIDPMVYPPLGLWYLGAQLEAQGHTCDFFDLSVDSLPEDGAYDQLWMSATSPQLHEVRKLGRLLKPYQKTVTVLGGAAPWTNDAQCMHLGFDAGVCGESDHPEVVRDILERAAQAKSRGDEITIYNKIQPKLDHVLPPIRRWSQRYHATLEGRDGKIHPTTTMFTSRGCPMACAFCESGRNGVIWDRFVRYETIDVVDAQLREIRDLGFTGVMFYDDILPLNKPRTDKILDLLKKYGMTWRCFLRTDVIAKQGGFEYLKQMADAGLVEVLAGVESADNQIKDNIHKGTTIEQDTQCLLWCKSLGIKFKASLILGLPGENHESMQRTREWVLKYQPDRVDVNTLIPFPGTPITTHASDYDVFWTEDYPEEFWYKGPRDDAKAVVGTSALFPHEIQLFHIQLMRDISAAGIPY